MMPVGRPPGWFRGSWSSVREIWGRRELLVLLVRRELRARYKNSNLGILWSLFRPIAQLLIYYFAIGQILGAARSIPAFGIFVFIGLTGWTVFTEIVTNGTKSIIDNRGLVKKIYLPREIFPLASVGGALVSLGIQLVILAAAMIVFGQFPLSWNLLWVVPSLLLIICFGTAVALLLSALNVYFRDFEHLVEVVLIVIFWASPIVYSYQFVASALAEHTWLRELYLANPITLGILGLQRGFWAAGAGDAGNWPPDLLIRMVIVSAASLVFLWVTQRIFARLQGNFAQEL